MKYWKQFVYWWNERKYLRKQNADLRAKIERQNAVIIAAADVYQKQRQKYENELIKLKVEQELKK